MTDSPENAERLVEDVADMRAELDALRAAQPGNALLYDRAVAAERAMGEWRSAAYNAAERHNAAEKERRDDAKQARADHESRRHVLADALGCTPETSWPSIIETARRMFEAGPVRSETVATHEAARQSAIRSYERAANRADQAEKQLAAARAEAEGLAETMRNTDRLTTKQANALHDAIRQLTDTSRARQTALAEALEHPAERHWADLIAAVRILRTEVLGGTQARAKADLTPLTVPVSPRETQTAGKDHPIHALREAIQGPGLPHYKGTELIRAYYDAITSGPPADPKPAPPPAAEEREQPAEPLLRGVDLAGYTAGMQAFITAYVQAVAPIFEQVARALNIAPESRR